MNVKLTAFISSCAIVAIIGAAGCQDSKVVETKNEGKQAQPALTFMLSQAQFTRDANGKPSPGAAKLRLITVRGGETSERILEDEESRVFHKALCTTTNDQTSVWTIGATGAHLKEWRLGDLSLAKTHYSGKFGGKWDRLRDIETLKDGQGRDLWAVATHDQGHVLIVDTQKGTSQTLHTEETTFVHEVEVGDLNGDGLDDFATTPSKPNKAGKSQPGRVDAYLQKPDGSFERAVALSADNRHAKEILVADWNLDGRAELYVVLEGRLGPNRELIKPVEVVRVELRDGRWAETGRTAIPGAKQARVLLLANIDTDRLNELVVTTMRAGIWAIHSYDEPVTQLISGKLSSGFEHAAAAVDVDNDGIAELFVSSEDQDQFTQWSLSDGRWNSSRLTDLGKSEITWSVELCN